MNSGLNVIMSTMYNTCMRQRRGHTGNEKAWITGRVGGNRRYAKEQERHLPVGGSAFYYVGILPFYIQKPCLSFSRTQMKYEIVIIIQ